MMVARSSRFAAVRRCSRSSSDTPVPDAESSVRPPSSICQTCCNESIPPRTSLTAAACCSDSTTMPTAPESPRIHATCSEEEVS